MSLKDELETAARSADVAAQRTCKLCNVILESEDEEERELLGGRRIGQATLAKILSSNGYEIGWRVIARHRREGHQPA